MAHTDPHDTPHDAAVGHETTDASVGGVERFLIVTGLFLVVSFALMWLMYTQFRSREAALDVAPSPVSQRQGDRLPPLPRLQRAPATDLSAFREAEQAELDAWGWVDQSSGIARIPVARAIELVAEHGLPPLEGATPAAPADASRPEGATTGR